MSIFEERDSVVLWKFFDHIYRNELSILGADYDDINYVENVIMNNRIRSFYKKDKHSVYEIEELKYLFRTISNISDENKKLYQGFFKRYMDKEMKYISSVEKETGVEGLLEATFGHR